MTTPTDKGRAVAIAKGENAETEIEMPLAFFSGIDGDQALAVGLVNQALNIGSKGPKQDKQGTDFVMAAVAGIAPRDPVETMLAMQMTAVHNATITFAQRLAHVETIPQQDSATRAFNQLARTFTAQVEALVRYRTGGKQKVTVQHVTVNEGEQAIVGNISKGGRGGNQT